METKEPSSTKNQHDPSKTPWKSIILCGFFALCTGTQFGLFFSSIWPYIQILDASSTESFLGWIIASYSKFFCDRVNLSRFDILGFGQIIAAPCVGFISNKLGTIRFPVIVCIFTQMIGNIIYGSAQLFNSNRKWAILIARFVNGIGASK